MKYLKNLLLFLIALTLVFALIGCNFQIDLGGGNNDNTNDNNDNDGDGDNNGDDGDSEAYKPLSLIKDGEAQFQLVVDKSSGTLLNLTARDFVNDMAALGFTVKLVEDEKKTESDGCEILVGNIVSRGDKYDYDEHTLGKKGYVVTKIDNKIIIAGDTVDIILTEFELLLDGILEAAENDEDFEFTESNEILEVQDDYLVTALLMNGEDMRGYTIAVDKQDGDFRKAASILQDTIYLRTGYWLEIVPINEKTDKSIVLSFADLTETDNKGFVVKGESNGQITILASYYNALENAITDFLASKITLSSGEVNFRTGKIFDKDVSKVYYADYDELTDKDQENDFEALKAVHAYANEGGQAVYAENGKTYYIGNCNNQKIVIQTDVYFGTAKFLIDDSFITTRDLASKHSNHVFSITDSTAKLTYTKSNDPKGIIDMLNDRGGIKTTDTSLPLNLGYDAMIVPMDHGVMMYKRGGDGDASTHDSGHVQRELIIVNADNSIDLSTRPLFDFAEVDELMIFRIDTDPITLSGGFFTTKATRGDNVSLNRGISISRSNVTITGMDHYVSNQPLGAPTATDSLGAIYNSGGPNYNGWIVPSNCNNLLVENTKLCGRTHYRQGSYDIGGGLANKMVFKNCTQYNMFIDDDPSKGVWQETRDYWGIMGTSYCKNIEYYDCVLSRLDAHAGVFNVVVKNCVMRSICGVGGGTFRVENTTVYNEYVAGLRSDYGGTWRGDVYIKNCHLIPSTNLAYGFQSLVHNGDYGFQTKLPTNIYIENLTHSLGENHEKFYAIGIKLSDAYFTPEPTIYNDFTPIGTIHIANQQPGYDYSRISRYGTENNSTTQDKIYADYGRPLYQNVAYDSKED